MEDLQRCSNGHYYPKDVRYCPYCPSTRKNKATGNTTSSDDMNQGNPNADVGADPYKTQSNLGNPGSNRDPNETIVPGFDDDDDDGIDLTKTYIKEVKVDESGEKHEKKARKERRLVGWLISYTIDDMGVDFRLFEGRNTVGTNPQNSITITNDVSISNHHLTILFRKDIFKVKDELSSNGTIINDKNLEPDEVLELKDGDEIKLGDTILIFKTPFNS